MPHRDHLRAASADPNTRRAWLAGPCHTVVDTTSNMKRGAMQGAQRPTCRRDAQRGAQLPRLKGHRRMPPFVAALGGLARCAVLPDAALLCPVSVRSLGDGHVRRYRNAGVTLWFNASFTLLFSLVAAGFVYRGVTVASHRSWIVLGGLIGLAVAWRFVRALRSGIDIDLNGVTVRSTIGPTRRARWDEVRARTVRVMGHESPAEMGSVIVFQAHQGIAYAGVSGISDQGSLGAPGMPHYSISRSAFPGICPRACAGIRHMVRSYDLGRHAATPLGATRLVRQWLADEGKSGPLGPGLLDGSVS